MRDYSWSSSPVLGCCGVHIVRDYSWSSSPVLPIEILSEGHSDPLSKNPRVKQPKLGVTTLK